MLAERLEQLELRIRDALAMLEHLRAERRSFESKVGALEADLARSAGELKTAQAERDQERAIRRRLEAERDEARTKVEGLLGELERIEVAVREGTA